MTLSGEIIDHQAIIDLEIEGVSGLARIPVVVDTGFNGELMLTNKTIETLRLDLLGHQGFFVANGNYVETDFFRGFIHWFGRRRVVGVLATYGEHNLLGMDLLSECKVTLDMPEKTVRIESVS